LLLGELEAKELLRKNGIAVNETRMARSREETIVISSEMGYPVALKVISPDIVHKSDCGGVKLDLKTAAQVGEAYDEVMTAVSQKCPEAKIQGISVQTMVIHGVEVIIGVSQDEQFGPVIMFGLGGLWVELMKDISFRVIPITQDDAADMVREIKGYGLLAGFRGQPAADIISLQEMLLRVSGFMEANPQVQELDLNPVFARPDGAVAVDARIVLEDIDPTGSKKQRKGRPSASLDFLFYPETVAVVGASNDPNSQGYDYMAHLLNYGYQGEIYPISLKQPEIMGVKAYQRLEDVPGSVDHVVCCIALEHVPALLNSGAGKGVKSVHIFSARGSETGREESKALEAEILKRARKYGIRLLGPNCVGIYCPDSGFSFSYDLPSEKGSVGAMIQSGGSSVDLIKFGALRGLRFSKVISYGNALDINEMDLLAYLAEDPETKVIIAFIEGLRGDGRDFLALVRQAAAKKPLIICKGGKSRAGVRCAMSHTASLAGSSPVWDIAIRQAGGIPVRDLDDLIHMAVALSYIPPIKGRRVGTGGSGGGRNAVSVDEWEDNGFEVVPLPQEIREEFRQRGAQLWDCIDNPADRSIMVPGDAYTVHALLLEMAKHPDFDFICANVSCEDFPFNREAFAFWVTDSFEEYMKLYKKSPKPFFLIFNDRPIGNTEMDSWFWREVGRMKTRLVEEKVPFFPNVDTAAQAVNEIINYYARHPISP